MDIGVIGTSIWQHNMSLLENLTISRDSRSEVIGELKKKLDVGEIIYLSTCNRVEFIYANTGHYRGAKLLHQIIDLFFKGKNDINFFPNDFFHFTGKEAITHLFRTASSMESMVMGENQISGQFKDAYQEAKDNNLVGPVLDRLVKETLTAARKVKGQTTLGSGALSMASLATRELKKTISNADQPLIAIIGSGPMQTKMANHVKSDLNARLLFVSRTIEKAKNLVDRFNGTALTLDNFKADPGNIDAIVSSTAAVEPIFNINFLNKLPFDNKAVVCVDLAIPRDFSIDFADDSRVKLVDIPYLKSKGQGNKRQKFIEAGKANEIISEAVGNYMMDQVEDSLRPIFRNSHQESMELAEKMLADIFENRLPEMREKDQEIIRRAIGRLIGHSSFNPIKKISNCLIEIDSGFNFEKLTKIKGKAT